MTDDDLRDAAIDFLFCHAPQLADDEQFVKAFTCYTLGLWHGFKEDAAEACIAIVEEQRQDWFARLTPGDN